MAGPKNRKRALVMAAAVLLSIVLMISLALSGKGNNSDPTPKAAGTGPSQPAESADSASESTGPTNPEAASETISPDQDPNLAEEAGIQTGPTPAQPDAGEGPQTESSSTRTDIANLTNWGRTLEIDFDRVLAAGCSDNINSFNQEVGDLVTQFGAHQRSVAGLSAAEAGQIPAQMSASLVELQDLVESIESKNVELAKLSKDCNSG